MSINKVIILGNVGKDPEVRKNDNSTIVNLTVATSEKWTDRKGEKQERTEWHNVTLFGKSAEFAEKYITKGSMVYVDGKIRTESYDKNGETKYITRIYADTLQILTPKKDGKQEQRPQMNPTSTVEDSFDGSEDMEDMPF